MEFNLEERWKNCVDLIKSNYQIPYIDNINSYDDAIFEKILYVFLINLYEGHRSEFVEIIGSLIYDAEKIQKKSNLSSKEFFFDKEIIEKIKTVLHDINFEFDLDMIQEAFSKFNKKNDIIMRVPPSPTAIYKPEQKAESITVATVNGFKDSDDKKTVFIVHGHDEGMKQGVARFIEQIDLNPIILHEKSNQGRHLLQKLKDYSHVGFAIILLSPDDLGKSVEETDLKPRARQNVIFELGYFIGCLEDKRVCAILKKPIEKPSDYDGITFIENDDRGAWKMEIMKELKSLGYQIDFGKAI